MFGIQESRAPNEWAIVRLPHEIQKIGKPFRALLLDAATQGNTEVVRALLSAGTSPDGQDHEGMTALHYAAKEGHADVARILMRANANINIVATGRLNITALHLAAEGLSYGHGEILDLLAERPDQQDLADKHGNQVLHYASRTNNLAAVKKLLDCNYSFDITNDADETPIDVVGTSDQTNKHQSIEISASIKSALQDALDKKHERDEIRKSRQFKNFSPSYN